MRDEVCLVPTERAVFSSVWWCSVVQFVCGGVEHGPGCLVWRVCGATPLVRGAGGRGGATPYPSPCTLHTDICVVSFVKWCADRRKERMRGFERFTLQVNLEPGTLQVNLGGFSATETG